MEPYPFRQGNNGRSTGGIQTRRASMEPYPFRQGNFDGQGRARGRQPRFNGALPIQAGKLTSVERVHRRWRASMEPYPFRQGNTEEHIELAYNRDASMEPYPFRQGNLILDWRVTDTRVI